MVPLVLGLLLLISFSLALVSVLGLASVFGEEIDGKAGGFLASASATKKAAIAVPAALSRRLSLP